MSASPDLYVIGVDPASTRLAFVGGWDDGSEVDPLATHAAHYSLGSDPYSPVKLMRADVFVHDFLATLPPTLQEQQSAVDRVVVVEEPLVGIGGVKSTIVQTKVSTAVQLVFLQHGWDVIGVAQSTWKADQIGHGGAKKPQIREHLRVNRRASYDRLAALAGLSGSAPTEDLCDALGIHGFGVRLRRRARSMAGAR